MARRAIGARRPVGQRDAFRRSRVGLVRTVARLGRLAAIQGQHQNRHRAHYGTRRAHPLVLRLFRIELFISPPFAGFVEYVEKRTPQSADANHPKQMNYV